MGLRTFKKKLQLAILAKRVWDRIEEESMKGNAKPALVGAGGMILTSVMANVFSACPELKTQWVAVALTGIGGVVTTLLLRPKERAGLKAVITGVGSAFVAGVVTQVTTLCPSLIAELPALLSAGLTTGLGLWLRSPREELAEKVVQKIGDEEATEILEETKAPKEL